MKLDYSEYMTQELAQKEIDAWEQDYVHGGYTYIAIQFLKMCVAKYPIADAIELCCGAGYLAEALDDDVSYLGIDNNPHMLAAAQERNNFRLFMKQDIRTVPVPDHADSRRDLAIMMASLKHFDKEYTVTDSVLLRGEYIDPKWKYVHPE